MSVFKSFGLAFALVVCLGASRNTVDELQRFGFSKAIAVKILKQSPDFMSKFNICAAALIRKPVINMDLASGKGKVIHFYRGVKLKRNQTFDANYNLFPTEGDPDSGGIYVTTNREIAFSYAKGGGPGVSLVVEYEIPVAMVSEGRLDDSYVLRTEILRQVGISDVSALQIKVTHVK